MIKREDSLRSIGFTTIGTEKETKSKLQAAADSFGMPLSEYLRDLADRETKDTQKTFVPGTGKVDRIKNIEENTTSIMQALDTMVNASSTGKLTEAEYNTIKNSKIKFILDDEIVDTFIAFYNAVKNMVQRPRMLNGYDKAVNDEA